MAFIIWKSSENLTFSIIGALRLGKLPARSAGKTQRVPSVQLAGFHSAVMFVKP